MNTLIVIMIGNRILRKRIYVHVEHVQPSRCTEEGEDWLVEGRSERKR
ncbi:hypothetical protein TorRG33x02_247360 [Trema orientale]|uniref:Uncharacterized protein n=1 Tax=Trema orientale TaxID=63057 RepID=A0A2P5DMG6_TREOI|nr:hypothetical protein TorRG33x02_247360 [Trema orientale]